MTRRDSTALNPDYLEFFATPAFIAQHREAAAINPVLKRLILDREAGQSGLDHSNVGGWHSGLDFIHWGGPALGKVLDAAMRLADQITRDRRGRPVKPGWQAECWANVNRRGHANKRHTHPGCFWSGTYYVDVGGLAGGRDGAFEFQDPRGVAAAWPQGFRAALPGAADDDAALVTPRDGMLVLFPSWLPHRVLPHYGEGPRISIAFNLALRRSA